MPSLREREAPKARVLVSIKDPVYGVPKKRRLVEVYGFTSVNSLVSSTAPGTATISFPNFKSALIRYVDQSTIGDTEYYNTGEETTNEEGFKFIQTITKESQSNFFKGLWNDMTLSKGDIELASRSDNKFMEYSRSRGAMATGKDRNVMKAINKGRYLYALPFIDTFDPVFIDYLGQDGFWYAGFTGTVSRVSDSYAKMADQTLTISCKDNATLLDNVSLVSGWNRLSVAESKTNLQNFVYSTETNQQASKEAGYSNIFARKYTKVSQIILALVAAAQDMWILDDFGEDIGVKAFFYDIGKVHPYEGISGRRGSIQINGDNPIDMNPEMFTQDHPLKKHHYMWDPDRKRGEKKILMDPLLLDFDNLFIHKMLSNGLALYKDSMKSADEILNEIVARMMAYKYFDANGNIVIEAAKYNALPNLTSYGGRSTATALRHAHPEIKEPDTIITKVTKKVRKGETISKFARRAGITVTKLKKLNGSLSNRKVFGQLDNGLYFLFNGASPVVGEKEQVTVEDPLANIKNMSVLPTEAVTLKDSDVDWKWSTLNFHGKNYVMSHDDFISFSTAVDESPLFTVSSMDSVYPFLEQLKDDIQKSRTTLHGVAVADYDMLAKLGVRRYQSQSLYNVSWPSDLVGTRVMSYQAAAILARINAQADSGNIQINHRPDLQVGRTYINPLRMKSYLIMGVANSWSPGGVHNTTLTVSYGHPIHKTLEVPWSAIFTEPEAFGFKNGIVDFNSLKVVTADGERQPNEVYKAPPAAGASDG